MSNESIDSSSNSESHLTGSLVRKAGNLSTATKLRGSLAATQKDRERLTLAPEGYDLPPGVAEQIERRKTHPDLKPTEDPEGVIEPGLLLTSKTDPLHRRLVACLYTTKLGSTIAVVHIEGESALRNKTLHDLHQRINEGLLIPQRPALDESGQTSA